MATSITPPAYINRQQVSRNKLSYCRSVLESTSQKFSTMAFGKFLFSLLVAVMVAFASANEFHHPEVTDLKGADFTEKVCSVLQCS